MLLRLTNSEDAIWRLDSDTVYGRIILCNPTLIFKIENSGDKYSIHKRKKFDLLLFILLYPVLGRIT